MSRQEKREETQFLHELSCASVHQTEGDYEKTGGRRWVIRKGRSWPAKVIENGTYPYVVMPNGEIRLSEYPTSRSSMHHPELCRDREVIGAGMLTVREKQIVDLSNESGHYTTDANSMYFVRKAFEHWNLPLSEDIKVDTKWEFTKP